MEVTLTPMNEVTEEFAIAEAEGDRTYQYWWDSHEKFFRNELGLMGHECSEHMLLVCERFKVIDVSNEYSGGGYGRI